MTESCDMTLLVQADFDGELDPGQAASLAAHRETCPVCQATYAQLGRTRENLRAGLTYYRPSPELRRAVSARLAEIASGPPIPPPSPSPVRLSPWWWRMAASFGLGAALAASVTLMVLPPQGEQSLAEQVVAGHIRSLQIGNNGVVVSTDRHTVKPWFDGKLDYAPPVKDLADDGFPLIGGRLDYLDGRPVAALDYARAKHPINLFVWPEPGAADREPGLVVRDGYNVIHWRRNGMALWAVSDVEKGELENFVRLWNAGP